LISAMVFSKDVLSLIPVVGCRCRCVRYILDENFEMIVREALRKLDLMLETRQWSTMVYS
jgi:hypothetical protein